MKSVFAFALVSFVCSNLGFADQRAFVNQNAMVQNRVRNVLAAGLTSFNVDARESFVGANSGSVMVDLSARTVTLNFERRPVCPPNRVCAQFIENLGQIVLPLVSRQVDSCGSVIYRAGRDLRRVDGALQELLVTDNTGNRCPHFVAMQPTSLVLTVVPARFSFNEQRVSTFSASKLMQTMTTIPFNGQPIFAQ